MFCRFQDWICWRGWPVALVLAAASVFVHEWIYEHKVFEVQAQNNPALVPVDSSELAAANITEEDCWVFYDPATAIPATVDPTSIWANRARAITITEVWCETDANTATINIQRDDGTPANLLSANLVCDTNPGQDSCVSGCDVNTIEAAEDNIAIDEELDHVTVSLGVINRLSVCIKYTVD